MPLIFFCDVAYIYVVRLKIMNCRYISTVPIFKHSNRKPKRAYNLRNNLLLTIIK